MLKKLLLIVGFLFSINILFAKTIFLTEDENFKVEIVESQNTIVYGQVKNTYNLIITNKLSNNQIISLKPIKYEGWEYRLSTSSLSIPKNSKKNVSITYILREDLEKYVLKDSKEDYILLEVLQIEEEVFEFGVDLIGESNQTAYLKLILDPDYFINLAFEPNLKTPYISVNQDLVFELFGPDVSKRDDLKFSIMLDNKKLEDFYNSKNLGFSNYAYFYKVPNSFESNREYELKIILYYLESKANPRVYTTKVFVNEYKNIEVLDITNETFSIWENRKVSLKNNGNTKDIYREYVNISSVERIFLSSDYDIQKDDNGFYYYEVFLNPNETKYLEYKIEYTLLATIILILIGIALVRFYFYLKIPLDLEIEISDVKKTQNEGIDSAKIRIKIENFKDTSYNKIYLIVKLPIYLKIFDNSFLIQEPTSLLKGKNFYKLVWELDNVRKFDTRYIGFLISNELRVIADIQIPPIEAQLVQNEKLQSYFLKVPKIKNE